VWSNLAGIQGEHASTLDMCQLILVETTYRDPLLADHFEMNIPNDATVRGVSVDVRRVGDDSVLDDAVRLVKDGKRGEAKRTVATPWSSEVAWVSYGGAADLWDEEWTAADLNDPSFGVALSAAYSKNVGNTLAYVDQVRLTVSYQRRCN